MSVKACYGIATTAIGRLRQKMDKAVAGLEDSDIKEYFNALLDDYNTTLTTTNAADLTSDFLDTLEINLRQDIMKIIDSARAGLENENYMDTILKQGINSKRGVVEALNSYYQRSLNLKDREILWLNRETKRLFDNLYLRGELDAPTAKRAQQAVESHVAGGNKLKNLLRDYGIVGNDEQAAEIWSALKKGRYTQEETGRSIPELHAIGKIFRELDDMLIARLQKNGSPIAKLEDHVTSIREDRAKLLKLGEEEFERIVRDRVKFREVLGEKIYQKDKATIEKNIKQWIRKRFKDKTAGGPFEMSKERTSNLGMSREIKFNSDADELAYYRATTVDGNDILRAAFTHKQKMLIDSKFYELHGANFTKSIGHVVKTMVKDQQVKKVLGDDALSFIELHAKQKAESIGLSSTGRAPISEVANTWYNVISNTASGLLTGWSGFRNLAYDNTFHVAWQRHNLNNTSFLAEWARAWADQLSAMSQVGKTRQFANAIEDMGIAVRISTNHLAQGILNSEKQFRGGKLDRWSHNFAEGIGKFSLGDWSFTSQRVMQSQHVSSIMERTFADGWDNMDPIVKRYFKEAGVSKSQFDALSKLPKVKIDNTIVGLDFKKAIGSDLEAFQSIKQNISRLQDAYINLHTNMLDDLVTRRVLRGSIDPNIGTGHALDRLIFKFWGMPLSQYRSFFRLTRLASGLDPDDGGITGLQDFHRSGKGLLKLSKFMLLAPTSGVMYMWSRDLLEGKNPRDVTGGTLVEALAFTGFGGIANMLIQDAYYNQDLVSSPLNVALESGRKVGKSLMAKDPDSLPRAVGKAGKRLIPFANTWLTSAAYDKILHDGLEIERSAWEKRREKERGRESFILDN